MHRFHTHEPADEYHARSRSGEMMSSHLLGDFRNSPALYFKKTTGAIEEQESPAYALGRAVHSLVLEGGDAFGRDFLVADGPVNPKTGEPFGKATRAYREWRESVSREIVSERDFGHIRKLRDSVLRNRAAAELLAVGEPEGVARAKVAGVPCQIRMDWFNPLKGLVDLKTCEALKWFESDAKRYGYVHQMAFYRSVIRELTGESVPVHIIAVEKSEPNSCGVWKLAENALDEAERHNLAALERYRRCRETGVWPTGYEEVRIIDSL